MIATNFLKLIFDGHFLCFIEEGHQISIERITIFPHIF